MLRTGAVLIVALAVPLGAQSRLTGRVDLAIGGIAEQRDSHMLSRVTGMAFDRAGRILVVDAGSGDARVFSPAGQFLYRIGQKGTGPGDLGGPCCVAIDGRGRAWIQETSNRRYSVFELGPERATFLYSVRAPGGAARIDDRVTWDASGRFSHTTHESSTTAPSRLVRLFTDSTGAVVRRDTLPVAARDSLDDIVVEKVVDGGRATYSMALPFGAAELRALGPGGEHAHAVSSSYSVSWYGPGGKLLRTIRRPANPPAVSAREKSEARAQVGEFATRVTASGAKVSATIPDRKAPIVGLGFDLDGRLWVERAVADGEPRQADVFDAMGRLVTVATWPADVALRFHQIRGNVALGLRLDADDVPVVVRIAFR